MQNSYGHPISFLVEEIDKLLLDKLNNVLDNEQKKMPIFLRKLPRSGKIQSEGFKKPLNGKFQNKIRIFQNKCRIKYAKGLKIKQKFRKQDYQIIAGDSVVDCFKG
jgi:tRNA G37 N-methylase Trm5